MDQGFGLTVIYLWRFICSNDTNIVRFKRNWTITLSDERGSKIGNDLYSLVNEQFAMGNHHAINR